RPAGKPNAERPLHLINPAGAATAAGGGYNAAHDERLRRRAGPLRPRPDETPGRPGDGTRLLRPAGPRSLREFYGRVRVVAPAASATLPCRLCLLPLGRRPGRRS